MASDVTNSTPPALGPQAESAARSAAPRPTPPRPDGGGRTFSDELSRQAAPVREPLKETVREPAAKDAAELSAPGRRDAAPAAKDGLAPLKKVALANKPDLDRSPVLALLTGHLERLTPAQIPGLVSGNKFLGDALGTADLAQFMGKPAPVDELLKDLDLSPALAQQAQQLGLDLSQAVAPSELLKIIGVDPQRVLAELQILKDNLSMGGVAPYIGRATALGAKDPARHEAAPAADAYAAALVRPAGLPQQVPSVGVIGAGMEPPVLPSVLPPSMPPGPSRPSLPGKGQADAGALGAGAPGAAAVPADLLALAQPFLTTQLPLLPGAAAVPAPEEQAAVPPAALRGLTATSAVLDAPSAGAPAEAGGAAAVVDAALAQAAGGLAVADAPRAPTMKRATFDAFSALGDKLRAGDAERVSNASELQAAPREGPKLAGSLAEQLLRDTLQNPPVAGPAAAAPRGGAELAATLVPDAAQTAAAVPAAAVQPAGPPAAAALLPTASLAAVRPEALLARLTGAGGTAGPNQAPGLQPAPGLAAAAQPAASAAAGDGRSAYALFDRWAGPAGPAGPALPVVAPGGVGARAGVPVDELRLTVPVLGRLAVADDDGAPGNGAGDDRKDGGKGDGRAALGSEARGDLLGGRRSVGHHDGPSFAMQLAPEPGLTGQQRVDLMQRVLDHATVLAKGGGGTVRLDLGSPELGPLEMAINLDHDRIDLRVVAGSERVRAAMLADLSGLKDALTTQNVRLGNVEVGVSQQQQRQPGGFAGFGGQGQSNRGAYNAQGDGQGDGRRPPPVPFATPPALVRRPLMPAAAAWVHEAAAGRIAVRA